MRSNELIQKVKDYFAEARKLMPEVTNDMLCDEGDGEKIYYMNGNDGTDFDWSANDRLCEFFMFYKSTEMGFIKVYVNSNDTMDGYVYKEEYKYGDEPIRLDRKKLGKEDALYFAALMYQIADRKDLYDKPISQLDFNHEVTWGELEDIRGYDDEEDDYWDEDDDY